MPGGRRHTDPPPFIPDLEHIYRSNAPEDSAQDFPGPAPKKYYYDGSSSPDKNKDKDKDKDTRRFKTFSWRKAAMDAEIEAERQSMETATVKMAAEYPVVAELVTSSVISNEYTLHNLAHVLSNLYNRPQSSITISQFYTSYLLHDHTRDPSYILTITVPPALSEGYANDFNAVALAQFLDEALAVPPRRGTIKFMPTPLACLAVGGRTLLGIFVEQIQADRAERAARDLLGEEEEERGRGRRRSISSLRGLGFSRSRSRPIEPIFETAQDEGEQADDEGKDEDSGEADDGSGSGSGKTGKGKRSLRSIFGRGGSS